MDDSLNIRECHTDELLEVRKMVGELHEQLLPLDSDLAPTEAILDEYLTYLVDTQAATRGAVFVADRAGELLGYVWVFGYCEADKDERPAPYTVVSDLYVRPGLRGAGLGEALMAKAESYAQALGVPRLELKVLAANLPARRFYERLGYQERVVILTKRFTGESKT